MVTPGIKNDQKLGWKIQQKIVQGRFDHNLVKNYHNTGSVMKEVTYVDILHVIYFSTFSVFVV